MNKQRTRKQPITKDNQRPGHGRVHPSEIWSNPTFMRIETGINSENDECFTSGPGCIWEAIIWSLDRIGDEMLEYIKRPAKVTWNVLRNFPESLHHQCPHLQTKDSYIRMSPTFSNHFNPELDKLHRGPSFEPMGLQQPPHSLRPLGGTVRRSNQQVLNIQRIWKKPNTAEGLFGFCCPHLGKHEFDGAFGTTEALLTTSHRQQQ